MTVGVAVRCTLLLLWLVWFSLSAPAENRLWLPGESEPGAACRTLKEMRPSLRSDAGLSPIVIHDNASLQGKAKLTPESGEFLYEKQRILLLTAEEKFPQVAWEDLGISSLENRGGLGNAGVGEGKLNGKRVIVKANDPVNRNPAVMLNEARWYLLLNKLGQGPEFMGLTRTPQGNLAVVMEFIEGVHFPAGGKVKDTPTFPILDSHIDDVLRLGKLLSAIGAEYTPDMQFRLTPDGRSVLIDPEFFQFTKPRIPPFDLPYNPKDNTEAIARVLRQLQKKQKLFGVATPQAKPDLPPGRIIIPGENDQEPRTPLKLIIPE